MLAVHVLDGQRQSEDVFAIYAKKSRRAKLRFSGIGQASEESVIEIANGLHERKRASGAMTKDGKTLVLRRTPPSGWAKSGDSIESLFPKELPSNYAAENHEFVTVIMG